MAKRNNAAINIQKIIRGNNTRDKKLVVTLKQQALKVENQRIKAAKVLGPNKNTPKSKSMASSMASSVAKTVAGVRARLEEALRMNRPTVSARMKAFTNKTPTKGPSSAETEWRKSNTKGPSR